MFFLYRWLKFYIFRSIPRYSISRDVQSRLFRDFHFTGKIISTDMFDQRSVKLTRSNIVGVPDLIAIVKDKGKKYCLIGERKGRLYKGNVRGHERNQVLLYMYLMQAYQPYPVIGRIAYNDRCIDIDLDASLIKSILSKKRSCMRLLKSLR